MRIRLSVIAKSAKPERLRSWHLVMPLQLAPTFGGDVCIALVDGQLL